MLAAEIISKIIRGAVLSAKVKRPDIKPLSVFLVAPIESGKTTLALQNAGEKPLVVSDVSGIGLLEALYQEKTVTHVVINDLAAVSGHRSSVSKLTISILNALAEEGCFKIALPRMGHLDLSGRRVGVLACCTPDLVDDNRTWWKRSGFTSRVLPIRYNHSVSLQIKIMQGIANGVHFEDGRILKIPDAELFVQIPNRQAQQILNLSLQLAKHYQEAGYRRQHQLRALACGLAINRGWKKPAVSQKEIDFLVEALPFFTQGQEI